MSNPDFNPFQVTNLQDALEHVADTMRQSFGVNKPADEPLSSHRVLTTANEVIHGERAQSYGPAEISFELIGDLWTTWLGNKLAPGEGIDAYDVAMLMTLMKVARARTDLKLDTFIDIAGYAALAPRCAEQAGRDG